MTLVNVHDRSTLERAYPADDFRRDAQRNETTDAVRHGVRIGRAPDRDGWFEVERAARHAGEAEAANFLEPALAHGAQAYSRFLDDVIEAARRFGFKPEDSPGQGDQRIRGLRQ
ncbi:MAG TPA: hypothetical protein VGG57_16495 [Stellaceae bacterium]|jgi:hypothetical protein